MTDDVDSIQPTRIEAANVACNPFDLLETRQHRAPEEKAVDDAHGIATRDKLTA